ncbi:mandelate racemase/muconate lactonizing enzyme family protein [Bordetella sp. BOR01]|uniref:mandelate racemase/muconate lactonizing enzyme family protein n=1 Tax=Bordetella sp. BOR01 TaxID=2854779 RepID=UPI001C477723|nr:mandelate racemase/muconate lactonizing enzyme family protein [Bordetella sp. BOR01]MBV7482725.1 mandelate racemase/muconate lactonizing enzyme family protein [Bordetella sp. BOR01]
MGDASSVYPAEVSVHVLRYPVERPVRTSFGIMHDRPAVFVRVQDRDGAHGWGEVWCNFPACGAEHRARLVDTVLRPLLVGRAYDGPAAAYAHLTAATEVLALQSGEPGPMAQAIAGIDLALWDLCARRAGQPLWAYLGGTSDRVEVYASGINPDEPEHVVQQKHREGYRAFKLKLGFGHERDLRNLRQVRQLLGPGVPLMADANQGWDAAGAATMAAAMGELDIAWLEEPLRADRPYAQWQALARQSPVPLAAGENYLGAEAFQSAIDAGFLKVVQPDLAKWGGISGCLPVIRAVRAAGLRYCPHYLGAGVGLMASAHLLAAVDGIGHKGLLEIDSNDNPLRTLLSGPLSQLEDGVAQLGTDPGIGVEPDLAALREYCGR